MECDEDEQRDMFPRELAHARILDALRQQKRVEQVAQEIENFWATFCYRQSLFDWYFKDSELYCFDFSISPGGLLTLSFYFPHQDETPDLAEANYQAAVNRMGHALDPSGKNPDEALLTCFLDWRLETYDNLEFSEKKLIRIREQLKPYLSQQQSAQIDFTNILLTNTWQKTIDQTGERPAIRLQAQLNPPTMVYIIDHVDELEQDAQESLFDLDQIKWWSRADGEGIAEFFERDSQSKTIDLDEISFFDGILSLLKVLYVIVLYLVNHVMLGSVKRIWQSLRQMFD